MPTYSWIPIAKKKTSWSCFVVRKGKRISNHLEMSLPMNLKTNHYNLSNNFQHTFNSLANICFINMRK